MLRSVIAVLVVVTGCLAQPTDTSLLVLDSSLTWEEGQWSNSQRRSYSYDGLYREEMVLQRWESVYWSNYSRTRFVWDNGRVVAEMNDRSTGTGWAPTDSTIFAYDANGNCTLSVQTSWRGEGTPQVEVTTTTMSYNNENQILDSTVVKYFNGEKSDTTQTLFDYTNGNLTSTSFYMYLADSSFGVAQKLDYTYDAQDRLETTVMSINFGTALMAYARFTNTYTDTQLTETITEMWDFATAAFKPVSRQLFSFDASGADSLTLTQVRRDNDWRDKNRTSFTWLPQGVVEIELIEDWDTVATQWVPRTTHLYGYEVMQVVGVRAAAARPMSARARPTLHATMNGLSVRGPTADTHLRAISLNGRMVLSGNGRLLMDEGLAGGTYLLHGRDPRNGVSRAQSLLLR